MSKTTDVSIQDIKEILKKKQSKIKDMEKMTNESKDKLKKIHEKMDEQQKELVTIITELAQSDENLDEVVIVGYGKQKRASVTGAVASVSNETLTVAPVANVSQSLAGRLPGLISKQESGLPGADAALLSIRGFGAPLVIVDGVQSSMNNIDSESIESITILKDASAAIYGARAGNGVILVTTKRGSTGKTNITFSSTGIIKFKT